MALGAVIAAGLLLAAVALVLLRFVRWRRRAYERVKTGSEVAHTSRGPIEYAIAGKGPAVVVLHGGVGGFDQGMALGGKDLGINESFTVIAPSRAGYLRTPLETCRTPAETADAIAALLDELGIENAAVIGFSGGGPTALQMALRHSERIWALVMVVAISRRHTQPARTTDGPGRVFFIDSALWLVDFVCWLVFVQIVRFRPALAAKWCFKGSETLDDAAIRQRVEQFRKDPAQIEWLRMLVAHLFPISIRKVGLVNDLKQFAEIEEYPVEQIVCPTLVVHGRYDGNVPFDNAEFVANGVPGAEMYVVEGCGHLFWLSEHVDEARTRIREFLKQQAPEARNPSEK